jgi:hypothetical protein
VKVDTQGAELAILEGMLELIRRSPSIVMAFEYSPSHLAGFGSTGVELLDVFATLELEMFDLGMGGATPTLVKAVTDDALRRRYSPKRKFFTNLLLVRGRPDVLAELAAQDEQASRE